MTTQKRLTDIHWLAGLLEGEGHFGQHHNGPSNKIYPRINLKMTDLDIVQRAYHILGCTGKIMMPKRYANEHSQTYAIQVTQQHRAIGWMMTLYPLLGKRRQAKITKIINDWKAG